MTDRMLVEVPENALRDEPIAFGLTAPQLGLLAVAAGIALVINLLPVPVVLRVAVVVLLSGSVVLVAVLPVRGEPAYRWLRRAARYGRSRRRWEAAVEGLDKSLISGVDRDGRSPDQSEREWSRSEAGVAPPETRDVSGRANGRGRGAPATSRSAPPNALTRSSADGPARLRVVRRGEEKSEEQRTSYDGAPHLVTGLRLACFLSFAGGVGKTTLAVETASIIASRGRYRTLEGIDHRLEVLLLDASRLNPAAGLRLGLEPRALSQLHEYRDWRDPRSVERAAVSSRSGVDVVALPPVLPLDPVERFHFGAADAYAVLDSAQHAGYQLVIADLGSVHEDGHRALIDQAAIVLGVVRPTLESLPDVLRLATYLRGLGMGRKLVLVGNAATDDRDLRRLAGEATAPLVALVPASASFSDAADRGEPAWASDRGVEAAVVPVATAVWPLPGAARPATNGLGEIIGGIGRALRPDGQRR